MIFRTIQLELTHISKTIAGLLTQPLSNVVIQLRELKSSQTAKRKQLESLEVRERGVLKRITSGESFEEGEENEEGSHDVSFGLPLSMEGGKVTEEQRLIQTGHLTPFGGHVHDDANNADSASPSSLGKDEFTSSSSGSGAVVKATPSIQLSSDSFDGLFSDAVSAKSQKKVTSLKNKTKNKRSDREKVSSTVQETQSGDLEPRLENGEWDNEEWMPDEAELALFESEMLSSSDSEYLTDDEMGSPKKKKQKRLRQLSSDEDEVEDSHVTSKRRGRKGKVKQRHYQDDGDDELYRLRIR